MSEWFKTIPTIGVAVGSVPYYVVVLESVAGKQVTQELRQSHLSYLASLKERGVLLVSGRFTDGSGGLYIVSAEGIEEAKRIASSDPYVLHGVRISQVKEWDRVY